MFVSVHIQENLEDEFVKEALKTVSDYYYDMSTIFLRIHNLLWPSITKITVYI